MYHKENVLMKLEEQLRTAKIQYDLVYDFLSKLLDEHISKNESVQNSETYQFYSKESDRLFGEILACKGLIKDIESGIIAFKE